MTIARELDKGRYYCRLSITGEYFFAQVTRDRDFKITASSRDLSWCPFLLQESEGKFLCSIHPTRPSFCREYRCSQLDILDAEGERRGRVSGKRSLVTKDLNLIAIWKKKIEPLLIENDLAWKKIVRTLLEQEGYQVIVFE
ncbi:MAG: YkgJ family cysteine cluster protein [Methanomicrobiales archaeon]|nr:YkgJ family cysteine cluster protein [Methanomicrobiales archaeon]